TRRKGHSCDNLSDNRAPLTLSVCTTGAGYIVARDKVCAIALRPLQPRQDQCPGAKRRLRREQGLHGLSTDRRGLEQVWPCFPDRCVTMTRRLPSECRRPDP